MTTTPQAQPDSTERLIEEFEYAVLCKTTGRDDADLRLVKAKEVIRAALAAQAAPSQIPEGWKLVPKIATPAMTKAGGHINSEWLNDSAPINEQRYALPMGGVWEAMLAASHQPPKEQP